jgi:hypothetical protein
MSPPNQGFKSSKSLAATDASGALALISACGASRGGGIQLSGTWVGTVQFEQTLDNGTTWIAKTVYPALGGAAVTSATANGQWKFACGGETQVRVRCSAFTSGTIVVDANFTSGLDQAVVGSGASASNPQAVIPNGTAYEAVAASQTAQAMGATGATGDYLSHVVFQPTSLAAATSTILDNATVIYTYTAGTLADLRPIVVPVNALSVSGAWKITTGANMTATGFGKFT